MAGGYRYREEVVEERVMGTTGARMELKDCDGDGCITVMLSSPPAIRAQRTPYTHHADAVAAAALDERW